MAKNNNIVHQYFKKEMEGIKILVKVNPILFEGMEITISPEGKEIRELQFDAEIFEAIVEVHHPGTCKPMQRLLRSHGA
ncbi:MAG: hypothetical protein L0Y35_02720, partial [Flammeovirgaceae bacterium]|nr:hypothetical protein [Flammeovirgaceae bacterium]